MTDANPVEILLRDLSSDELRDLLMLNRQFRNRFAAVAKELIVAGNEMQIENSAVRFSITAECLLLAATMHQGDDDQFLQAAAAAMSYAKARIKPSTETVN